MENNRKLIERYLDLEEDRYVTLLSREELLINWLSVYLTDFQREALEQEIKNWKPMDLPDVFEILK